MKLCKGCGKDIEQRIEFEGKVIRLNKRKYCLSCSPFKVYNVKKSKNPILLCDEYLFKDYVLKSFSYANVLKLMGITPTGAYYIVVKQRIKQLNLDISHFTGQSYLKGKSHNFGRPIPLNEVLIENSSYENTNNLKHRLLKEKLFEHKCSCCQLTHWLGEPIPIQLDHVNGIRNDNRIENLRILCPTCHALTPTYCGKNIRKHKLKS